VGVAVTASGEGLREGSLEKEWRGEGSGGGDARRGVTGAFRPRTAWHTIRPMEEDGCPKLRMNEAAPKEIDCRSPDLFFVSLSFA
jgi:hypothetical protein